MVFVLVSDYARKFICLIANKSFALGNRILTVNYSYHIKIVSPVHSYHIRQKGELTRQDITRVSIYLSSIVIFSEAGYTNQPN